MKNLILIFFCSAIFSCAKTAKKKEIPLEVFQEKEVVIPIVEAEKERIVFTVQIAALEKVNNALNNIENVHIFQENTLTKYRIGAFETYKEARVFRTQLIRTYKDAFVQALLDDTPISIKEALQY
tara:strand:- start:40 stop:414 length:375 start_codon:yes stop_codon:yes gene_type:complete